jgi:hypothetical protein
MSKNDTVQIENVSIKRETQKAFLIICEDYEGDPQEIWCPKSQIKDTDTIAVGDTGYIVIPRWLAVEKKLIEDEED